MDLSDPPVAVFTMHPDEPAPISVVVVTPSRDGAEAEVVDVRQPESAYTAAYRQGDPPREHSAVPPPPEPDEPAITPEDKPPPAGEPAHEDWPVADTSLLVPLKQSTEYQALDGRLLAPEPVDAWQEDEHHFFTFQLMPVDVPGSSGNPLAVFAMKPDTITPISAVVVMPGADGEDVAIVNLSESVGRTAPWQD